MPFPTSLTSLRYSHCYTTYSQTLDITSERFLSSETPWSYPDGRRKSKLIGPIP